MNAAEARAILREHGEEPPPNGRLGQEWYDQAEALRAELTSGDYDQGVTAGDFQPDAEGVTSAAPPPADTPGPDTGPGQVEQQPRRAKVSRPGLRDRMRAPGGTKPKPRGKAKAKHPRVSVAPLVSHLWAALGGLATQVDRPLGVCLSMQSPVAGVILEDVVKGTVVDRGLQPLARMEDKAEKVAALAGPPLCVAGLEMAQRLPDEQRKMREALIWPLLIESLVLSERVAGQYSEQMAERAAAEGPARDRARQLAELIFATPPAPEEPTQK